MIAKDKSKEEDRRVDLVFTESTSIADALKELAPSRILHHNCQMSWSQNNLKDLKLH